MLIQRLAAFKVRHAELIAIADERITALKAAQLKLRDYHAKHFMGQGRTNTTTRTF